MAIELKAVSYVYDQGTIRQTEALKDINLKIDKGEFVGMIGHTGSGKSTLIQLLNGLEKPTEGQVLFAGEDIFQKNYSLRILRQKVGLVFQYPEHQLFEETILKDVCFGPLNLGMSEEDAIVRAKAALKSVGIKNELLDHSPFELSGGQKRRVAIAGVLAMEPEYLILDEPAAGLDPVGRDAILDCIKNLHEKKRMGIILVSHSMEEVSKYAGRLIVLNDGQILFDDVPKRVFRHYRQLEHIGLAAPQITYIMQQLKKNGLNVDTDIIDLVEAKENIEKSLKKENSFQIHKKE